jgi:hypothetical protein
MRTEPESMERTLDLTPELRSSLLELVTCARPAISPAHAEQLIELGLAAHWADIIVITGAGRRALYSSRKDQASHARTTSAANLPRRSPAHL